MNAFEAGTPALGNLEEQRQNALKEAMKEAEDRFVEEMANVIATVPDKEEAIKIMKEKWALLTSELSKKSAEVIKAHPAVTQD
jgi:hypothetical protein